MGQRPVAASVPRRGRPCIKGGQSPASNVEYPAHPRNPMSSGQASDPRHSPCYCAAGALYSIAYEEASDPEPAKPSDGPARVSCAREVAFFPPRASPRLSAAVLSRMPVDSGAHPRAARCPIWRGGGIGPDTLQRRGRIPPVNTNPLRYQRTTAAWQRTSN
jgi:hypothetical protein